MAPNNSKQNIKSSGTFSLAKGPTIYKENKRSNPEPEDIETGHGVGFTPGK